LVFSRDLRPSKQRQLWMNHFEEKEFKSLKNVKLSEVSCDENRCIIKAKKKFLVLLQRNKLSEICKNDFDVIVNLTRRYELPSCIKENKIKIDNLDFLQKGGWFFYFEDGEMVFRSSVD
jgi:hypothetical protein